MQEDVERKTGSLAMLLLLPMYPCSPPKEGEVFTSFSTDIHCCMYGFIPGHLPQKEVLFCALGFIF